MPGRWTRRRRLRPNAPHATRAAVWMLLLVVAGPACRTGWALGDAPRPNILLCISDDQSWCHTGIAGDPVVQTPAYDRIAREGVLFQHAYCAAPSCAPSRAAILTGRPVWQLEQGANMRSHLPVQFACYTDLLAASGYHVGSTGKGWGPGQLNGRSQNPAGPQYKSFQEFLDALPEGAPFCFWFGSTNPHRPYPQPHPRADALLDRVRVPPVFPDAEPVRRDLLDYLHEIDLFDRQLGDLVGELERRNTLARTLVVVTSDNGMPMPRGKCNLYDLGTRMPMAVRWGESVPPGRVVDDFVSLADLAPTFLEAAGLPVPRGMAGKSLMPLLRSGGQGQIDPARDHVVTARERHSVTRPDAGGYPMRAIRTAEFLYIRNYEPDRGPTGTPAGTADVDPSPTASFMLENRTDPRIAPLVRLAFDRRPAEELYDLRRDPHQMENVAEVPEYAETCQTLAERLTAHLVATADPRHHGRGSHFDEYPFFSNPGDARRRAGQSGDE